ncbi:MAG: glutamine--fructose-6-phosphate transaminase (isomerizing) [Flavobacteriaceae bacterium]|jgi:glutamine---fructose-6-phosphate transaminase (isomerizing)|nr:glutamine--fructose-6-phosphate transaminase (isomerizing) [Flavobacteriaceae bacterium]MBT4113232.1 glutamine--fructose-6-phosphate transaminase (isomerizing) [Flavobacteriaceae bacterium]MBT5247139.1 glutamine--fructose-6-phosphate transaminase (isomerizing) [Flavobacteriaceae bacterium]MBT5649625.1 glutamine--fructose-6-phosphate transaminase (isomerizing) [Flavobacteriaceae bacterium]MBT5772271.1 glutamine--fructose-6-phosphate transaminase (isomerizing) [Flavobacteriaceae bacterium]
MCGIVGYLGLKDASPIILNGLKRLEYRGYDSAGISIYNGNKILTRKSKGKIDTLEKSITKVKSFKGNLGIGHTRWATHGEPNNKNAHPHVSNSNELHIVHNGIIENYSSLKEELITKGFHFNSDTDTEVLVNLIEYIQIKEKIKLGEAVQLALNQVVGAYAIAVIDIKKPDEIVVAKLGSPLCIGIGKDEYFIGSDVTPFLDHTKKVVYLKDGEMGMIRNHKPARYRKIGDDSFVRPTIEKLEINLARIQKKGFDHFMLKEIFEQPSAVTDTLRGRLKVKRGIIKMSGIDDYIDKFISTNKITIIACGTSWHAGLIGEYIFEKIARIPVEVEYASEFRYRDPVINNSDVVIAISQSGETADTLSAIKLAKEEGAFVYGICNVAGSSISRETDAGSYTHAGPEIGVASTKAFITQITVLFLIAVKLGKSRGVISSKKYQEYIYELNSIEKKIKKVLKTDNEIKKIANCIKNSTNCLYLGRGFNFPVALEGALKLKEISYIHAEGYPAAEMKHGPIALIDKNMPSIIIATNTLYYDKILSNIQEIKSRKGKIIAIVFEGDKEIVKIADHLIEVPETIAALTPFLTTIPLQLLAYHIAVKLGRNVDQPRNLAKSVTVE